ncbi:twitching motility protein PilT [Plantibacter flavus]|uniref:Twitching motility protein PilT n=1 Tax=Plantibacter flavus TaxID=150123 RepID=A0A3N2BXP0_9MICO|nr:type IV pilus twitching motility protein PilT [Plantibacter flavus]ROR80006.1 twitching motility protein PilT [Plantibacter flavus]SMG28434.1 twitching motility protein PilT [Plantibacter flavus]
MISDPSPLLDPFAGETLDGLLHMGGEPQPPTPADLHHEPVFTPPSPISPTAGLHAVLLEAVTRKASDVHVTAGTAPMLRVMGELQPVTAEFPTWGAASIERELFSLLSDAQAASLRERSELDLALTIENGSRFRVNVFRQRGTYAAAFRLVPDRIRSLRELGMSDDIAAFADRPRGLVLVTGPTGSGKSTTLAALLDLVNAKRSCHIMTIEDPIEFVHANKRSIVNQREVGSDTTSFGMALRQVLRQDPDVILIGELRDHETISVALTAAETGHLVLASLHTQTAAQTIDRIVDAFPSHQQNQVRMQLASTLQGVVCQALLPRRDGGGRIAATEILQVTPAVSNLIREGKNYQIPTAIQAGRNVGMISLEQSLAGLVNTGVISAHDARSRITDDEQFTRMLHGAGNEGVR